MPIGIIAGIIGFIISDNIWGIVTIPSERYGNYIYHLLALTFIAISLKVSYNSDLKKTVGTGILLFIGYAVQIIAGGIVAWVLILTFYPELFPNFGFLFFWGFGQGPGQAYSIGASWEALGCTSCGNTGLFFASLGYVSACSSIIFFLFYSKKLRDKIPEPSKKMDIKRYMKIKVIIALMIHIGVILFVYGITWYALRILTSYINELNLNFSNQVAATLWGAHFILASFIALAFKSVFLNTVVYKYIDNKLLNRLSSILVDYMVFFSLSAISVILVKDFIVPILLITLVGILFLLIAIHYATPFIFKHNINEKKAGLWGTLTGTLSTGLILIKVFDPQLKNNSAYELTLGAGIATPLCIPLIGIMMIPILNIWKVETSLLISIGAAIIYTLTVVILSFIFMRKISTKNE